MPPSATAASRVHYVSPFTKDSELVPGDVRIPLFVWAMAAGGGAAILGGVPPYLVARTVVSRLEGGDFTIRTDAERQELIAHGKRMEALGLGLWAVGGTLLAASWTAVYVFNVRDEVTAQTDANGRRKRPVWKLEVAPAGAGMMLRLQHP